MKPTFSRIHAVSKPADAEEEPQDREDHDPDERDLQPERDAGAGQGEAIRSGWRPDAGEDRVAPVPASSVVTQTPVALRDLS